MAYCALVSLSRTLDEIPQPVQQHITSLKEKVHCLLVDLEEQSRTNSLAINDLEAQIRDAAFEAEDIIESHISRQLVLPSTFVSFGVLGSCCRSLERVYLQDVDLEFQGDLEKVTDEFDSILEALSKMKNGKVADVQSGISVTTAGSSRSVAIDKSTMVVGVDEDLLHLKDRLTGWPPKLDIISVVGMGGIGKTTLAKSLYNDPLIEHHFDTRAWIAVSQEYHLQELLRALLEQCTRPGDKKLDQESYGELTEFLYKSLKGRRYLILIDDVWDTKAWDGMRRYFPDENNGSRIVLTTRLAEVASYANSDSSIHHMSLLSLETSWNLLREKVFGKECCPFELEEIGKEIANRCRGLPLAIVVIGGVLSKGSKTVDYWKYVARNTRSVVTGNEDELMEILSLSYNSLPHHLKACFLYMGVFPEDYVIRASQLIWLWITEGFIRTHIAKSLEEVAEDYLNDLIDRSLILVHQRDHIGGVKTCIIHDLLRELCIKKAQDEKFFQLMKGDLPICLKEKKSQRRVSVHQDIHWLTNVDDRHVRSIVYFDRALSNDELIAFAISCRLLRVFDTLMIWFNKLPSQIFELVHLRYLAFNYLGTELSASICKLRNLQVLIVYRAARIYPPFYLPSTIWEMPQLRHVLLYRCFLPYPKPAQIRGEGSFLLENLQTLSQVANFRCSKEVLEMMPNLKKLEILYTFDRRAKWSSDEFNNFLYLPKLETLKCHFAWNDVTSGCLPVDFAFPSSLKRLTLRGCQIPWEKMSVVGSLPNLEALKLKDKAFKGLVWEPIEGEFNKLKFLLIHNSNLKHWRAKETHFPQLQHLSLNNCNSLKEIPSEIGEIPTLEVIEVNYCSSSAVSSARLIHEEQKGFGNNNLTVLVDSHRLG